MRSIRTVALAVASTLLAAAPVLAGPTKPVPPPDPSVAPVVAELHKVVALLNAADHDYRGHRAEAVHLVHKAIHALHPHHKVVAPGTTTPKPPTVKEPAPKEDQAKSDAQLKQAVQALQTIQTQLSSSTAAHHKKAAAEIQGAIAELNTALTIK